MRGFRLWAYGALLIGLVVGWTGCDSRPESDVADEVPRASFLIEQKQYSEAIYILSDRLRHQPGDTKARVILASAYAARGGISLTSYTSFVNELSKWKKIDELLPVEDDKGFVQAIAKASLRIQLMIRAFQAIPSPASLAAAEDLRMALKTLDEAGSLTGGPALYRALMRIMVFKQDLFLTNPPRIERGCIADAREVSEWVRTLLASLEMIFRDTSQGFVDSSARKIADGFSLKMREVIDEIDLEKLNTQDGLLSLPPALRMLLGPCE